MKILVTGLSGFIGSHLVDVLLSHRHKVYGISKINSNENPLTLSYKINIHIVNYLAKE